jgi:hypothetical protein
MSRVDPLGKLGDVELSTIPAVVYETQDVARWMVAHRGQTLLDVQDVGDATLRLTQRAPGLPSISRKGPPGSASSATRGIQRPVAIGRRSSSPLETARPEAPGRGRWS